MSRAGRLSLRVLLLETLSDVDRAEDLLVWRSVEKTAASEVAEEISHPVETISKTDEKISIVIPTFNEEDYLSDTLNSLKCRNNFEVIVVDGGSTDKTPEIAEREGCRLIFSDPGRSLQANAGASMASGSILFFLHADTRLPFGFDCAIRAALSRPGVVGGAFQLRIDGVGFLLRMIERAVTIRSRLLRMPYGDQGLFVHKNIFRELCGFAPLPIMEDFEFVRRLRDRGQIQILPLSLTTSDRRWRKLGPFSTTLINQKVILGYHLGISPDRLALWYGRRANY